MKVFQIKWNITCTFLCCIRVEYRAFYIFGVNIRRNLNKVSYLYAENIEKVRKYDVEYI